MVLGKKSIYIPIPAAHLTTYTACANPLTFLDLKQGSNPSVRRSKRNVKPTPEICFQSSQG